MIRNYVLQNVPVVFNKIYKPSYNFHGVWGNEGTCTATNPLTMWINNQIIDIDLYIRNTEDTVLILLINNKCVLNIIRVKY